MKHLNLYVALLGGNQADDKIEAHNLFVGAAEKLEQLLPQMKKAWSGVTHVDAYMVLTQLDGYNVMVREHTQQEKRDSTQYPRLMVYNIGYYKPGQFAEFHKLIPMVLKNKDDQWLTRLKADPDFAEGRHLTEAVRSHVDDKLNVSGICFDADDAIDIQQQVPGYIIDLVPLQPGEPVIENTLKLGYLFVKELKGMVG